VTRLGTLKPGARFRLRNGRCGTVLETAPLWVLVVMDVTKPPQAGSRRCYLPPVFEVDELKDE